MSRSFSDAIALERARWGAALRQPHNWMQLAKFCAVGASGYAVNLGVFSALLLGAGIHHLPAATASFLVAVTNNYTWNRLWTFRGQRGHIAYQGIRFLIVSLCALAANEVLLTTLVALGHVAYQGLRFLVVAICALVANLVALEALVWLGLPEIPAQAIAIVLVMPLNFVGNKLWSFRRRS